MAEPITPDRLPENAWYRIELPSGEFTIRGRRPRGHSVGHTWRNKFAFIQHLEAMGWVWEHNPQECPERLSGTYHSCEALYDPNRVFKYYEGSTVIAYASPVVPSSLPAWKRAELRHVKGPFQEMGRQEFTHFLAAEMAILKKIARRR